VVIPQELNKSARNASTADVDGWQPLIGIRERGNGKRGKIPRGKKEKKATGARECIGTGWCDVTPL